VKPNLNARLAGSAASYVARNGLPENRFCKLCLGALPKSKGTKPRSFCCTDHANIYKQSRARAKNAKYVVPDPTFIDGGGAVDHAQARTTSAASHKLAGMRLGKKSDGLKVRNESALPHGDTNSATVEYLDSRLRERDVLVALEGLSETMRELCLPGVRKKFPNIDRALAQRSHERKLLRSCEDSSKGYA
jgi:hypothetical protein